MVRLYIRHRVADYDAWRNAYDDFAGQQQAAGVRAEAVYQSLDDPDDVTVWHDFDDAGAAQAFVGSAAASRRHGLSRRPGRTAAVVHTGALREA